MTHRLSALTLLIPLAGLTACDRTPAEPLSSQTVRASLRDNARLHAHDSAGMLSDLLSSGFLEIAYRQACEATATEDGQDCSAPNLQLDQADVDAEVDDIVDKFFADDRVVSETPAEVVYAIPSRDICEDDAECIGDLDRLTLQLVATSPAPDSIDVVLRVSGHDPLVAHLAPDSIVVELDLAEARAAVAAHPDVFDLDASDLPTAVGRLEASLSRVSARHYQAALAVTEDIAVELPGRYALSIGAAPLLSVDVDAGAERVEATVAVDWVSATLPAPALDFLFDGLLEDGVAQVELGGLTAHAVLANADQNLTITGLGLGQTTTTLSLDGTQLIALDLNATFGRQLDLTVSAGDDRIGFAFSPAVTVAAGLFLQPLLDRGQDVPAWALDSTSEVRFTATSGPPALSISTERTRVDNGTLVFSSSEMASPVSVDAGLCIEANDTEDQSHPFQSLYGATCE